MLRGRSVLCSVLFQVAMTAVEATGAVGIASRLHTFSSSMSTAMG